MIKIKTSSYKTENLKKIIHYETKENPLDKESWVYFDEYFLEPNENPADIIDEFIRKHAGKLGNTKVVKVSDILYYASSGNGEYHVFEVKQ
jgi:hypothetical protein